MQLPCNSTNLLLGSYPREMKTQVHKTILAFLKTCTQMLTGTLFVITKDWKQYKYPPVSEQLN